MSISLRFGLGAALLAVVGVGAWVRHTLDERLRAFETQSNAFAAANPGPKATTPPARTDPAPAEPDPTAIAARTVALTPAAARTWAALGRTVDLPFPIETPLEDVVAYLRASTRADDLPDGLPFYLDPVALAEAEQTPLSPVAIDLKGIPLARGLGLALAQLGLGYHVDADGLIRVGEDGPVEGTDRLNGRPVVIGERDLAVLLAHAAAYRAAKGESLGECSTHDVHGFCATFGGSGGFR